MTWTPNDLETYVESELVNDYPEERAKEIIAGYRDARPKVLLEIERIAQTEPNLTDHGPRHIQDVMNRVLSVISMNRDEHGLNARDLYVLLMAILFHDVGNLYGRSRHNERIGRMFDYARGTDAKVRREKALVRKAAQAHSGKSSAGDENTLIELDDREHSPDGVIQLLSIAAVLRFADELAEGPQRTTEFYRTEIGYEEKSDIYHQYARCTSVLADRANGRVCLSYDIYLDDYLLASGELDKKKLIKLFEFIKHRIGKLDQERRYTRYYCKIIEPFKSTEVKIDFSYRGERLAYDIFFVLDDLVIPGQSGQGSEIVVNERFGETTLIADRLVDAMKEPGEYDEQK